jgi:hypothetical protein
LDSLDGLVHVAIDILRVVLHVGRAAGGSC